MVAGSLLLGSCQDEPPPTATRVIGAPPASGSAAGAGSTSAAGSSTPRAPGLVKSDEDCRRARACQHFGACSYRDGGCYAKTDADCAKSQFCQRAGQCKVHKDRCVIGADSDADCRRNHGKTGRNPCKLSGYCTALGGVCVATSDDDCRQSLACRQSAACTAKDGECLLTSAQDCELSVLCKHGKQCLFKLVDGRGVCYEDKEPEHKGHNH